LYENEKKTISALGVTPHRALPLDPAMGSAPDPCHRLELRSTVRLPLANPGSTNVRNFIKEKYFIAPYNSSDTVDN